MKKPNQKHFVESNWWKDYFWLVQFYSNLGKTINQTKSRMNFDPSSEFEFDIILNQIGAGSKYYELILKNKMVKQGFAGEILIPKVINVDTAYIDLVGSNFDAQFVFSYLHRANNKLDFSITKTTGINDTISGTLLRAIIVAAEGSPVDPDSNQGHMQSLWVSSGTAIGADGSIISSDINPEDAPVEQGDQSIFDPDEGISESNLYCVENLLVSDNAIYCCYQANSLESDATVLDTVTFKAFEEISLKAGFEVVKGASFNASIQPCGF